MPLSTFYFHPDGSASPNKPWYGNPVMTYDAETRQKAEKKLPYLDPRDIYALIYTPSTGHQTVICDLDSLRGIGMNDHLFIGHGHVSGSAIEVIGVPYSRLDVEVARFAKLTVASQGRNIRIIPFYDAAWFDPQLERGMHPAEAPSGRRKWKVKKLTKMLRLLVVSPKVEIGPIGPCGYGMLHREC